MLDTGRLRPDDEVFLAAERKWVPLEDFLSLTSPIPGTPSEAPQVDPGEDPQEDKPNDEEPATEGTRGESSRRRRSSSRKSSHKNSCERRKRNALEIALPGWIAALFALVIATALGFWGNSLSQQLDAARERERGLMENAANYQSQINALMESVPPGRVRGIVSMEPAPGRLAVVSGASVALFPRAEIEKFVEVKSASPLPATNVEFNATLNRIKRDLPPPLDLTLTDSNGRFEIKAPGPGDYVIFTSATKRAEGRTTHMFWLQSVRIDDLPSQLVPLSEANSIQLQAPALRITPPRP
ncbi:MAG: hypothetical protein Fur0032_23230 [Terrimicrobiaceae bacterium]